MSLKVCRIFVFILFFTGCFVLGFSQKAYHIDWEKEKIYLGTQVGLNGIGLALHFTTKDLSYEDWLQLDPNKVISFDQKVIGKYDSPRANHISDYIANGSYVLPLIIYLSKIKDTEWNESSIMYLELIALNAAAATISKNTFLRPRPYVYTTHLEQGGSIDKSGRNSFISGHTSTTASNAFFAAAIFHKAYPDSWLVPFVYGTAIGLPALTGVYRVRAGKHFPTDVIAGYLVGMASAMTIIQLHKRDDLVFLSTSEGVGLVLTF